MLIEQFFINGLGCASYLLVCEDPKIAAVVDPDRDVEKYLQAARRHDATIQYIIETHLHADHISGNTALAQRCGAEICLHEAAQAQFTHRALKAGETLWLGSVRLEFLHTPGHTYDSIVILASDSQRARDPRVALTGDTLFIGDVGRPDLVGRDNAQQLASKMFASLREKIPPLEDDLVIYPGHGVGSLCGRSISDARSSTLGYERLHNPALQIHSLPAFLQYASSDLPEQPGNYVNIKRANHTGPTILGNLEFKPLSLQEAIPYFQRGAAMLDTRSKVAYIEKHVPGAIHMEGDELLSGRIGFILPPELPIVLVVDDPQAYRQAAFSLARVGFENLAGALANGLQEWEAMGLPLTSGDIEDLTPQALYELLQSSNGNRPVVVDVREPWEYAQRHIPGAILIPLGELSQRINQLDP